jgi:hypothetical protein
MAYLVEFFEEIRGDVWHEGPYWRGLFTSLEDIAKRVPGWVRFKQRQLARREAAAVGAAGAAAAPKPFSITKEELEAMFDKYPKDTNEIYEHTFYRLSGGTSLKVTVSWVELFAGEPVSDSEEE